MALSEGGLALIGNLPFDQGDGIRLKILRNEFAEPVKVSGIVWNEREAATSGGASRLRRIGCVVSHPSRSFRALLDLLDPSGAAEAEKQERAQTAQFEAAVFGGIGGDSTDSQEAIPVARPSARSAEEESALLEPDLPRSRELEPPPKREPEETLPFFRLRMKQVGGPRTRIMTVQARSATQAETRALEELEAIPGDTSQWALLHVARLK